MAGPGLVVTQPPVSSGHQIAEEQIWKADEYGVLRLLYPVGARILPEDAALLGIVDGRLQIRDKADVAPTEKARRRATEDKARRPSSVEDKTEMEAH